MFSSKTRHIPEESPELKPKKHESLKEMLDSNKDSLKLEAMKKIIGLMAKGKDAADLFPSVVKNVISKNVEVKKLVYMYIIRYAETQQDLVLLSISTFQRALKEPNQLIRANALKVLSSIKVGMIIPIVLLAIKDAVVDLSAYVRKTSVFAISKLYELDPNQKPELIGCIDKLLNDRTKLVIGPAVMVFQKICPERIDLIHKIYRKLCYFILDLDEWSQVITINLLTRYVRTQFIDPNLKSGDQPLDPDHLLLLKYVKPLLQSQNSSVVVSVAQLYYHTAPDVELIVIIKPLIRLLRSCPEIQTIVLDVISTIMLKHKTLFQSYLKTFFIRRSDVPKVKTSKLNILTYLADPKNILVILKELKSYIESTDKDFVVSTISAIGRCACGVSEVTDTCLNGLLTMLGSKDTRVVSEVVVVIKDLIRFKPEPYGVIKQLVRILDQIGSPRARGTIIWLVCEYYDGVEKMAPDVLRKVAKRFPDEADEVKLLALNLAVRLHIRGEDNVKLCEYVFNMGRYDKSYDIRDRVRLLKYFLENGNGFLKAAQQEIFFGKKPTSPTPMIAIKDKQRLQLGSLSHFLNGCVDGYGLLPDFAIVPGDRSLRDHKGSLDDLEGEKRCIERLKGKGWKEELRCLKNTKEGKKEVKRFDRSKKDPKKKIGPKTYWLGLNDKLRSRSCLDKSSSCVERSRYSDMETSRKTTGLYRRKSCSGLDKTGFVESSDTSSSELISVTSFNPKSNPPIEEESTPLDKESYEIFDKESTSERSTSSGDESKKSQSQTQESGEDSTDSSTSKSACSVSSGSVTNNPASTEDPSMNKPLLDKPKLGVDDLLDLEGPSPSGSTFLSTSTKYDFDLLLDVDSTISESIPVLTPCRSGFPSPIVSHPSQPPTKPQVLLDKITGGGLSISYKFTRYPHISSPKLTNISLTFTNHHHQDVTNINIHQTGVVFTPIDRLSPNCSLPRFLGVNFNDTIQSIKLDLTSSLGTTTVHIKPPIGELIRPICLSEEKFSKEQFKLRGMNEHTLTVHSDRIIDLPEQVFRLININRIPNAHDHLYWFAGETLSTNSIVLVSIAAIDKSYKLTVNCDQIVIGSLLINDLKTIF